MTLVPDDALVSPRYTTNKVAEVMDVLHASIVEPASSGDSG